MQITNQAQINARADQSPRFECIIGATYIGAIWAYTSDMGTIFDSVVYAQFVGTMHAGTAHESTWEEGDGPGWIEDGNARKGDLISSAFFDDFTEALDHLMSETKRLLTEQFGGLDAKSLAV